MSRLSWMIIFAACIQSECVWHNKVRLLLFFCLFSMYFKHCIVTFCFICFSDQPQQQSVQWGNKGRWHHQRDQPTKNSWIKLLWRPTAHQKRHRSAAVGDIQVSHVFVPHDLTGICLVQDLLLLSSLEFLFLARLLPRFRAVVLYVSLFYVLIFLNCRFMQYIRRYSYTSITLRLESLWGRLADKFVAEVSRFCFCFLSTFVLSSFRRLH